MTPAKRTSGPRNGVSAISGPCQAREGGAPNWVKVRVSEAIDIALAVALVEEAVQANA
jgi:hypothetical protein